MTTDDTSYRDLHEGDARAYEALPLAVRKAITELLLPLKGFYRNDSLRNKSPTEFFQDFISHAEEFPKSCSEACAKIVAQSTVLPEIRAIPTSSLAKEIRQAAFEKLDHQLGLMTQLQTIMEDHQKRCQSNKLDGLMLAQGQSILEQGHAASIQSIGEYLPMVKELTEHVLDYCCARCFGGQVSLERQQIALESIQSAIAEELDQAAQVIRAIGEAERSGVGT